MRFSAWLRSLGRGLWWWLWRHAGDVQQTATELVQIAEDGSLDQVSIMIAMSMPAIVREAWIRARCSGVNTAVVMRHFDAVGKATTVSVIAIFEQGSGAPLSDEKRVYEAFVKAEESGA